MKVFDIITPRRVALVALAAAIALAVVALVTNFVGPNPGWPLTALLAAVPLLVFAGILWLRGALAAWAGAVAGLGLPTLWLIVLIDALNQPWNPVSLEDAIGFSVMVSVAALIGLAGFLSELPRLHLPHLHHRHASAAGRQP